MSQQDASFAVFDCSRLTDSSEPVRTAASIEFCEVAGAAGCMMLTGLDETVFGLAALNRLGAVFNIDEAERRRLAKQTFVPANPNVYRGWFERRDPSRSGTEGLDLGPDIVRTVERADPSDPITEPTPLPSFEGAADWLDAAHAYYEANEAIGFTLMRSIATGLGLARNFFDAPFANGVSTLRMLRYVQGPDGVAEDLREDGAAILTGAHVDSGLVTLLAQDDVGGLQFEGRDGSWIDVPQRPTSLVVNFGLLLEHWTQGRIRATRHRVLDRGVERMSTPFFFEPSETAEIAPLPGVGADAFEPFLYGDYLWDKATKFKEQSGARALRAPRGRVPA